MSDAVRQRYGLATGKGLTPAPSKSATPGYRNGGKVSKPAPRGGGMKGGRSPKC